jgi:hypothetical protein
MSIGSVLTSTLPTAQPRVPPQADGGGDHDPVAEDAAKSLAASTKPTPSHHTPSHRGQKVNTAA